MKKIFYLLTFTILVFTIACESNLDNEEISLVKESSLNGDWIVTAYIDNDTSFGPFDIKMQVITNENTVSIKDEGQFWGFQVQATADLSKNTFESSSSLNEISLVEAKIKLLEGKLIGKDSLSFNIQFEDDVIPYGITYNLKGSRKQ